MQDREYAYFKRASEWYAIDPAFRLAVSEKPAEAMAKIGFTPRDPEAALAAAAALSLGRFAETGENPYIAEFVRRNAIVSAYVERTHSRGAFANYMTYRFTDTVRNRCRMESHVLRLHNNIYYFPLSFELSQGCSVQCPFCGLDAPPWAADYRYTPENAKLWRGILHASLEFLGPVAGTAPCYLATEPLDNPDYERFLADFAEITGLVPQTTTAVADRDAERLRGLMKWLGPERLEREAALRITVRTRKQFYRIAELFSPEELIGVELVPNNPESMNRYAAAGRARSGKTGKQELLPYSICCTAGVRVNMARRSMQFIEPEIPDEYFPQGVRVRETCFFTDAGDYKEKLVRLFETWAAGILPDQRALKWNRHCQIAAQEDSILFIGDGIAYRVPRNVFTEQAVDLVRSGRTLPEIRNELALPAQWQPDFDALLNQLFIRGYLRIM